MNVKSFSQVLAFAALAAAAAGAHAASFDEYSLNQNYPAPVAREAAAPRVAAQVAQVDEYQRNQFPAAAGVTLLQRVQVQAEAKQARKLGLIAEGEAAAPVATAAQIEQIRQAGLDAVQHHVATR